MNIIDLHQRMVRNIFLNVEIFLNDKIDDLSEYDVQSLMFNYFSRALLNTDATAARERVEKVDCVVYRLSAPVLLYELKTYYKKHEKPKKSHFDHDIKKLSNLLQKNTDARAYFVLAGRKSKFKENVLTEFPWLVQRLKSKSLKWVNYKLPDGSIVRMRPSQKQDYGRGLAVTWEIKSATTCSNKPPI